LLQKVHLVLDAAKVCGVDCSCFADISLWYYLRHYNRLLWGQLEYNFGYLDFLSFNTIFGYEETLTDYEDEHATFAHPDGHWSSCSRVARARHNHHVHLCRNRRTHTRRGRKTFPKKQEGGRCNVLNGKDFILQ